MGAYKYKDEEAHQRHLAKRRAYYQANHARIRHQDNESARRNRQKNPERYRKYWDDYKARHGDELAPKPVTFENNPERDLILREIENERSMAGHG